MCHRLWQALVLGDAPAIKQHAEAMNAGEMYPLFVAMLTQVGCEGVVMEGTNPPDNPCTAHMHPRTWLPPLRSGPGSS